MKHPLLTITDDILTERNKSYGKAVDSFYAIANMWSTYLNRAATQSEEGIELSASNVADMMILLKVCREANTHKIDNYIDICGYAVLGNELCEAFDSSKNT